MTWRQILVAIIAWVFGAGVGIWLARIFFERRRPVAKKSAASGQDNLQIMRAELVKKPDRPSRSKVLPESGAADKAAKEGVDGLYRGNVEIKVLPPVEAEQLRMLKEYLTQIPDCHLVFSGDSAAVGQYFVLSLVKPLKLGEQLKAIPMVDQVFKRDQKILIMLN
jgi:uncharacterized protein YneF (UPF0154 family)